jgi:hypothetical protein
LALLYRSVGNEETVARLGQVVKVAMSSDSGIPQNPEVLKRFTVSG